MWNTNVFHPVRCYFKDRFKASIPWNLDDKILKHHGETCTWKPRLVHKAELVTMCVPYKLRASGFRVPKNERETCLVCAAIPAANVLSCQ